MWKALGFASLVVMISGCSGLTSRSGDGIGNGNGGSNSRGGSGGSAGVSTHAGGGVGRGGSAAAGSGGKSESGASSGARAGSFTADAGAAGSAGEQNGAAGSGGSLPGGTGGATVMGGSTNGGASEGGSSAGGSVATDAGAGGESGGGGGFPPRPICGDRVIPNNTAWCVGIENLELSFEGVNDAGGDGKMSPGEEGSVVVRMHNAGSEVLESPCLGMFANRPGVTLLELFNPKLMLFGLNGGTSWTARLRFRVEPSVAPGSRIRFMVWVDAHTAGCAGGGDVEFELEVAP